MLLAVGVPSLGLGIFIFLLRNRTSTFASDLASCSPQFWVSHVVRIPCVSGVHLWASFFLLRFYLSVHRLWLYPAALVSGPTLSPDFIPRPDIPSCLTLICLICSPSDAYLFLIPRSSLHFEGFQVLAYILWDLCFTLGTPDVKGPLGPIPR